MYDKSNVYELTIVGMIANCLDKNYEIIIFLKDQNQNTYIANTDALTSCIDINCYSKTEFYNWINNNINDNSLFYISMEQQQVTSDLENIPLNKSFLKQCEFLQIKSIPNFVHYLINYNKGFESVDIINGEIVGIINRDVIDNTIDTSVIIKSDSQLYELNFNCQMNNTFDKIIKWNINFQETESEFILYDKNSECFIPKSLQTIELDLDICDMLDAKAYNINNIILFNTLNIYFNTSDLIQCTTQDIIMYSQFDEENRKMLLESVYKNTLSEVTIDTTLDIIDMQMDELEQIDIAFEPLDIEALR